VPLEETIWTVNHLIEGGKADYWGTSEFIATEIQECHKICDKYGYIHPIAEQCQYNLLWRENLEVTLAPLLDRYGLGSTVWSPLCGGILSGKYNDMQIPTDSRFNDPNLPPPVKERYMKFFEEANREKTHTMLQGLSAISSELGCTQAQLSLAWCIKNPDVSSAIFGATRLQQAEDNLGALDVVSRLTPEVLARIEEVVQSRPQPPMNWRNWTPMPARR